jgi:hypothetical protein
MKALGLRAMQQGFGGAFPGQGRESTWLALSIGEFLAMIMATCIPS